MNGEFKRAVKLIDQMNDGELEKMREICREIQLAQDGLMKKADKAMERCKHDCQGLCCKNIELEDIIEYHDFVYILALRNSIRKVASECLKKETLFRSDCVFLKDGKGPCVFPQGVRPKICVMTFCGDTRDIKKEIARVGTGFGKLYRFVWLQKPKIMKRLIAKKLSQFRPGG